MAALACINDVLLRIVLPKQFDGFWLFMMNEIITIMRAQAQLTPAFTDHLLTAVSTFVSKHLPRIETTANAAVQSFLEVFYAFTFAQTDADRFRGCVEVWVLFCEHLNIEGGSTGNYKHTMYPLYEKGLLFTAVKMVDKLSFASNHQVEFCHDARRC